MANPRFDQTIRDRMPYPIASAWQRVKLATDEGERVQRLLEASEILLRTLVAFVLPDYLRGEPSDRVERILPRLDRPSDGTWLELLREILRCLASRAEPPFIAEAPRWCFDTQERPSRGMSLLDEVVALRNEVAHGGAAVSAAQSGARAEALEAKLRDVLTSLAWLAGYRPLRVLQATPTRRRTFAGRLQFLIGDRGMSEPVDGEWDAYLTPGPVYLADPRGDALLELSPFLEVAADERTHEEHRYLLKALPKMRRVLGVHDPSGARLEGDEGLARGAFVSTRRAGPEVLHFPYPLQALEQIAAADAEHAHGPGVEVP